MARLAKQQQQYLYLQKAEEAWKDHTKFPGHQKGIGDVTHVTQHKLGRVPTFLTGDECERDGMSVAFGVGRVLGPLSLRQTVHLTQQLCTTALLLVTSDQVAIAVTAWINRTTTATFGTACAHAVDHVEVVTPLLQQQRHEGEGYQLPDP